ncbi:hypothetical protein [Litoreibacter arenae]|uniref:Membrane-associated oxidoreductase n=1 Tax=Litoreibacter arenae DSM 19593 TaxID=1123360 RepID=S9Q8L9_9RHOB|nr:hypothetical protein [Litoreibacter arenae]EPX77716.1 hypothetical protein thalar_03441 [Litoreibacter arenae DSM 19593]
MNSLDTFAPFSAAEQKLIDDSTNPERTSVGDGNLHKAAEPVHTIRGELIRHLLLGFDALHDKGIRLRGAWISGTLDLQGCDCERDISLSHCHLSNPINLVNARLRGLHLSACYLTGLSADNTSFSGSVYIRAGTIVMGEISMAGARISGDLQICDATIESLTQDAIFAPSLRVEGSVFLGNYPYANSVTELHATGLLFFSSARVEHDFFITNTSINLPQTSTVAATVFDPSEEHGYGMALSLARARINGILYMTDNHITKGMVNLAAAEVARFRDEPVGPGASYPIRLDGFRYSDFSRHVDTKITARLDWLARKPDDMPFTSQPYEQLATVLQSLGHRKDARSVLMHKERLLRAEDRRLMAERGVNGPRRALARVADDFLRWTIGYGYRPGRAVVVAIVMIVSLGVFFQRTWDAGDMAPNAAPILVSQDWVAATRSHPDNPAVFWSAPGQGGQDWETFNAFAYAADVVIPLVNFGQEGAWAPSTSRSPLGKIAWWVRWFAKSIGWIVAALGAGAITGLIRKD